MYKSQFQQTGPYDWFSGPGSHISHVCPSHALMCIHILQ